MKSIHYLHLFYQGNPAACLTIAAFLLLLAVALWTTPLCDKEFDAYMQKYEDARALNRDLRGEA